MDWSVAKWKKELQRAEDDGLTSQLRRSTHTGYPLATDRFLSKLEHKLGRRIRPNPVGRPGRPKARKEAKGKRKRVCK